MDKYLIKLNQKPSEALPATSSQVTVTKELDDTQSTSTRANKAQVDSHAVSLSGATETPEIVNPSGRRFQSHWTKQFPWIITYENKKIFCKVCVKAVKEIKAPLPKLSASEKKSLNAFVKDGFKSWSKALERFRVHERSSVHRACSLALESVEAGANVSECLNSAKIVDMKAARNALLAIITSLRYLAQQGLAIRGHTDERSNFRRLLLLRAEDNYTLMSWLGRTQYKWLSHDVLNEIISIMSKSVQRALLDKITSSEFYSIMIDETADISVKEQISVCFRTVDENLSVNEYFMGFYETAETNAETLQIIVKDILSRFSLNIHKCRGQCYDGASSVSGKISGLQTRIKNDEPRALFVHCTAHTLNLVVQDSLQGIPVVRNFLTVMKDLITFVRNSPKRVACFNKLQKDSEAESPSDMTSIYRLRPFCPTRWCLRIISLQIMESNYEVLLEFLNKLSDERGEPGAKASGFLKQLLKFENVFLMKFMIRVFSRIETLNSHLQKTSLHLQNVVNSVDILKKSLQQKRENDFDFLWDDSLKRCAEFKIEQPVLARKRKIPRRLDDSSATTYYFKTPKDKYRQIFLEVVDQTLSSLNTRFQSDTMDHLAKMEMFATGLEYIKTVTNFYGSDFDEERLKLHRDMFLDIAKQEGSKIENINDALIFLQNRKNVHKMTGEMLSEFQRFITCLVTVPTSTCTTERSFSCLRRLKTYIRQTMGQQRLNDLAMLHVHQDESQALNVDNVANEFIDCSAIRRNTFHRAPK